MERCQDECVNGSQQLRSGRSDKAVIKVLKMQWQGNDNTFEEIFQNTLTVLLLKELAINLFVAICYRGGKGIAAFKHSNTCAPIPVLKYHLNHLYSKMLLLQVLAASPSAPRTDKQERNMPRPWKANVFRSWNGFGCCVEK